MDSTDVNMKVVAGIFTKIEDLHIKIEPELSTVVVFDEVHVKQEVKEEPVEYVETGSSDFNGFHNYIKYELAGPSQSVCCDSCSMNYKNAEDLKQHQKSSPMCKEYKNCGLSVVEDKPGGICSKHFEQPSIRTAEVDRCMDAIPGGSGNVPVYNMNPSVELIKINRNIKHTSEKNQRHTRQGPFTCDVCNKTFTQRGNLNIHKLKHTGERQFICDVCNQTFNRKGTLNSHKLKHTGERPFVCDVCKQTFAHKSTLNTHKLKHTGERPFACDVCIQTFTHKSNLTRHKLKHTGERPFSCDVCNQTFIHKSTLNIHKLKHTGECPFACDVCNQTFAHKGTLNTHKLKHTGEKRFCCDVCLKSYTEKKNLVKHMRLHVMK